MNRLMMISLFLVIRYFGLGRFHNFITSTTELPCVGYRLRYMKILALIVNVFVNSLQVEQLCAIRGEARRTTVMHAARIRLTGRRSRLIIVPDTASAQESRPWMDLQVNSNCTIVDFLSTNQQISVNHYHN
jgi:hypothetical protein